MSDIEKQLEILAIERSVLADDLCDLVQIRLSNVAQRLDVCDVLSNDLSRTTSQ